MQHNHVLTISGSKAAIDSITQEAMDGPFSANIIVSILPDNSNPLRRKPNYQSEPEILVNIAIGVVSGIAGNTAYAWLRAQFDRWKQRHSVKIEDTTNRIKE